MNRREILQSIAALAGVRWESEGIDIDDIDGTDAILGTIDVGTISPAQIHFQGNGVYTGWLVDPEDLTEQGVNVYYDEEVNLAIEGCGGDIYSGAGATLSAEQARDLSVLLFQAAEELDRRRNTEA